MILGARSGSVEVLMRDSVRVELRGIIFFNQSDQTCSSVIGFLDVPGSLQNTQWVSLRRVLIRDSGLTLGILPPMATKPSDEKYDKVKRAKKTKKQKSTK